MHEADTLVIKMDYQQAIQLYLAIYSPRDEQLNYKLGRAYSLAGDKSNAKKYLENAIRIDPNGPHYKKYFEYAQLSSPLVAVESFNKAVDLLQSLLEECIDFNKEPKIRKDLVSAYCSLAEIY